jgi:dienelactone hydrolase
MTAQARFGFPVFPLLAAFLACGASSEPPVSQPASAKEVHLFDYDARAPLGIRVLSTTKDDALTVQEIEYASPRGGRVPATLIVPEGPGPFAGVILLHGVPGHRQQLFPAAEELARRGAVTLAIDAPFSRPGRLDDEPFHLDERDRDDQIQLIVDLRRGVDLLVSRPDVDPKRLGFSGGSYGGAMGGLFAGVERRIKAYALFVGDGGLVSHFTGPGVKDNSLDRLPKEQAERWLAAMRQVEPIRFVGRAAPAHLLFQNARQDEMVSTENARAFQEAGSKPKLILWYDSGHRLPPEALRDRNDWLANQLGLRTLRSG